MLRESNENALNMNGKDLEKIFKLELPPLDKDTGADGTGLVDKTSKEYYDKIQNLRAM